MTDHRDMALEMLAADEAAAAADAGALRELAHVAIERLHQVTTERDHVRRALRLRRDELRALRQQMSSATPGSLK